MLTRITVPGWWETPLIDAPLPQASSSATKAGANKDGWVHKSYDISYGAPVKIRFVYTNGADSAAWGWGINHISISNASEQGLSKAQSADVASWNANGWSRNSSVGKMWYPLATGYYPITRVLGMESLSVPAGGTTKMSFMTRYTNTAADMFVEVSNDGGFTWQPVTGTVNDISGSTISLAAGSGDKWVPASYDLSAYAGQSVKLRFRLKASVTSGGAGGHWGVDNIGIANSVSGGVFADDAETLKSEWEPSYWIRAPFATEGMGGGAWGY